MQILNWVSNNSKKLFFIIAPFSIISGVTVVISFTTDNLPYIPPPNTAGSYILYIIAHLGFLFAIIALSQNKNK